MVTKYAMSEKVGPIAVEDEDKISGELRKLIEAEELVLLRVGGMKRIWEEWPFD